MTASGGTGAGSQHTTTGEPTGDLACIGRDPAN